MKKSMLLILLALPFELSIMHHARAMKEISIEEASRQVWEILEKDDYTTFNQLHKTLIKQLNIDAKLDLNVHLNENNPQHLKYKTIMNSLNEENITPFLYAIQQKKIRHIGHLSYLNIPDFNALFNNKNYLQHAIDLKDPKFLIEFLKSISLNKNFNEIFNINTNTPLADYVIDEYTKAPTDTALWNTIKVLFNKSPRFERLTLFTAIDKNNQGFVEKLITEKPELLTAQHETTQQTPLHFALAQEKNDIAARLLQARPEDANTLLFQETESGNATVVKNLLTINPKLIGARNASQATPLHIAVHYAHKNLITYLLDNGADPLAVDNNNQTIRDYAQLRDTTQSTDQAASTTTTQDLLKSIMVEYVANLIATSTDQEHIKALLEQNIITPDDQNSPLLHLAITHKKPVVLDSLIKLKFPLNNPNAANQTPLLHAITDDNTTAAVALLKAGADYSIKDTNGNAAVHLAVIHNNEAVFDELIALNAPLATFNKDGNTPLHLALDANQAPFAIKILTHNQTPSFLTLLDNNNISLFDRIANLPHNNPIKISAQKTQGFMAINMNRMAKRAKSDFKDPLAQAFKDLDTQQHKQQLEGKTTEEKYTILIKAVQDPDALPLIQTIIKEGNLDINALSSSDTSSVRLEKNPIKRAIDSFIQMLIKWEGDISPQKAPLHVAAQHGTLPIVYYLLQSGANVTRRDTQGNTPLDYAIANDQETVVHFLLQHLAKLPTEYVNQQSVRPLYLTDKYYPAELTYPLHAAALYGNDNAISYFMSKGYEINRPDHQENTPLHKALETFARTSSQNMLHSIKLLIEAGANLLHHNAQNLSPLDIIATLDQKAQLLPLVQESLNTSFRHAIIQKNIHHAVMYYELGANANAQDAAGNAPLHLAAQQGDLLITYLLLRLGANPATLNKQSKQPFDVSANTSVSILLSAATQKDKYHHVHQAIETGNLLLVQVLLEDQHLFGTYDIKGVDQFDTTPLAYAVAGNHYDIAHYLLKNKVSIFDTVAYQPLYFYAKTQNFTQLSTLLYNELFKHCAKRFSTLNVPTLQHYIEHGILDRQQGAELFKQLDKPTLLYWINFVVNHRNNRINNHNTLSLLLTDINAPDERNKTLLHYATEENNTLVAKVLLEHGALADTIIIPGRTQELDETLLSWALTNNDAELAIIAVRNGAHPNVIFGKNQTTPLHWAIENNHYELLAALLEKGANINKKNARQETPLQLARTYKRVAMINALHHHAQTLHAQETDHKDASLKTPIKQQKKITRSLDSQAKEKVQAAIWHAAYTGSDTTKLPSGKISVNIVNENNETPLHIAAGKGHASVVNYLIKHGASINPLNTLKQTPLHYAAKHNHSDIVTMLLKTKDANSQRTSTDGSLALHHAAFNGNVTIANALISHQTKKHTTNPINHANNNGYTPLHIAAQQGHVDMVTYLLKKNASIDVPNNHGNTPLHLAAQYGHDAIVNVLLQDETQKTLQNKDGDTPLDLACQNNHINVIEVLENARVKLLWQAVHNNFKGYSILIKSVYPLIKKYPPLIAITNEYLSTPLHLAAGHGDREVVRDLLAHNAPVNSVNIHKDTPLHFAVDANHRNVVDELLQAGAISTLSNIDGYLPLHLAAIRGNIDIAQLLLNNNATVLNHQTNDGFTPLSFAIKNNDIRMIKLFVDHGSDSKFTQNDFRKLTFFGVQNKNPELVKFALEKQYSPNNDNNSILHMAIQEGMLEVVTFIAEQNPSLINTPNKHYETPLAIADQRGHRHITSFLLSKGAYSLDSNGNTPLHLAAQQGDLETVFTLLKSKLNPAAVNKHNKQPFHVTTNPAVAILLNAAIQKDTRHQTEILHEAIETGSLVLVQLLLENQDLFGKYNINNVDQFDISPLGYAVAGNHYDIARYLLANKASVLGTIAQQPLYFYALEKNFIPLSTLLYEHLVNHCAQGFKTHNTTTLHGYVEHGILDQHQGAELFKQLDKPTFFYWINVVVNHTNPRINNPRTLSLLLTPDVHMPDNNNKTLLHYAIEKNNTAVAKALLEHGALATDKTTHALDQAVLTWLLKNNNAELAIIAIHNGAYPDIVLDENQDTPLIWSIKNNNAQLFDALLEKGATFNRANKKNKTPLMIAHQYKRTAMINKLTPYAQAHPVQKTTQKARLQAKDTSTVDKDLFAQDDQLFYGLDEDYQIKKEKPQKRSQKPHQPKDPRSRFFVDMPAPGLQSKPQPSTRKPSHKKALPQAPHSGKAQQSTHEKASWQNEQGETPLHIAAFNGDNAVITTLLDQYKEGLIKKDNYGNTPLHGAAHQGHANTVKLLLFHKAPLNAQNNDGNTALHLAAQAGQTPVVKLLMQQENQKTLTNKSGHTPLDLACQNNHISVIKILAPTPFEAFLQGLKDGNMKNMQIAESLIKKHPSLVAIPNKSKTTPLHIAAINGHLEVVNYLLNNNAPVNSVTINNNTPLHFAVDRHHEAIVNTLLNNGANSTLSNIDGYLPLHLAAMHGNSKIAHLLLNNNATIINQKTKTGETPLSIAVENNDIMMIQLFVDYGTDFKLRQNDFNNLISLAIQNNKPDIVNVALQEKYTPNNDNNSILHMGVLEGMLDVVEFIVRNNPNLIKTPNIQGNTPLLIAAQHGLEDIAQYLLNNGAYYRDNNKDGNKPLHLAAQEGHASVAQLLISKNQDMQKDINMRNNQGNTPLHLAVNNAYVPVIELLLTNNADVNASNQDKNTPLHLAAQNGYLHIVTHLLKKGAFINAQNKDGNTPLHLAKEKNHNATIDFLRSHKDANLQIKNNKGETALTFKTTN